MINGVLSFKGGHGISSYSLTTSITGGTGYCGFGDGGARNASGKSGVVELRYTILNRVGASNLDSSPAFDAISKIVIVIGTDDNGVEQVYTAGTDTGYTLTLVCPWGTQSMANNLLAALGGVTYQPYVAGGALIDPAAELGDAVYVGGITSVVYTMDTTFDALYTADISAPQEEEIDHEYPYEPKENREIVRKTATITAELRVDVDTITATVSGKIDGTTAQSMIDTSISGITLSASAGANQSTITITANGVTVDSAVVTFSSIVADSIVANASITSPVITGGTISGTEIQSTSTFQGVTYGTFINDGNIDLKWGNTIYGRITLGDALGETKFRTFNYIDLILEASGFLKLKSGTGGNSGFAGLILDSSMYGTLAQRPAAGTAGRIFFVRA